MVPSETKHTNRIFGGWVSPCFGYVEPFIREKLVLDVGCGDGTYLQRFSEESIGIDISNANLELCKQRGLQVIKGDLNKGIPFGNDELDVIFCSHILEHVDAPINLLRECYRMLVNDGILVICVPNEASLIRCFYPYFDEHGGHQYAFSPMNIQVLLRECGFSIVGTYPDFHTMKSHQWHLTGLLNILTRLPLQWTRRLFHAHWTIARKP